MPWSEIGDGSVFDPQPAEGPALRSRCGPTRERVQKVYGQSVEYTLGAMFSFLHTYDQPNLVLVVLGDHQPARIVSGPDADRDVPITIISKDPAVFDAHRLVGVGAGRATRRRRAGLADGSVPRSALRGVQPLTTGARQAPPRTAVPSGCRVSCDDGARSTSTLVIASTTMPIDSTITVCGTSMKSHV